MAAQQKKLAAVVAGRLDGFLRHPGSEDMRRIPISIIAAVAWTASANLPARAETINVYDDHGGVVPDYDARWAALAARGVDVKIVGPCQSACTILSRIFPTTTSA